MTRKTFVALAAALRDTGAAEETVVAVANVCAASNVNFDRDRFYTAAGLPHA